MAESPSNTAAGGVSDDALASRIEKLEAQVKELQAKLADLEKLKEQADQLAQKVFGKGLKLVLSK